jgi:hypothetical protein
MKLPIIKINFVPIIRFIKKYILRKKLPEKIFFGLKRDIKDDRDHIYKSRRPLKELPDSTHMKNINAFHVRYDQQNLGSCVGNGVLAAFRRTLQVNKQPDFDGSRLFAYYNARSDEDKPSDSGASIRDGIKALNKYGLCSEAMWPYIVARFAEKPPPEAFNEGLDHQALQYDRIYPVTKDAIKDALVQGYPIVYGKILYESFMTEEVSRTGIVPLPRKCCDNEIGGHCMDIFDYDNEGLWELNSWGADWGINGICKIPWKYVLDPKLAFDFWVVYLTE